MYFYRDIIQTDTTDTRHLNYNVPVQTAKVTTVWNWESSYRHMPYSHVLLTHKNDDGSTLDSNTSRRWQYRYGPHHLIYRCKWISEQPRYASVEGSGTQRTQMTHLIMLLYYFISLLTNSFNHTNDITIWPMLFTIMWAHLVNNSLMFISTEMLVYTESSWWLYARGASTVRWLIKT